MPVAGIVAAEGISKATIGFADGPSVDEFGRDLIVLRVALRRAARPPIWRSSRWPESGKLRSLAKWPIDGSANHGGILRVITACLIALAHGRVGFVSEQRHRRGFARAMAGLAVLFEDRQHIAVKGRRGGVKAQASTRKRTARICFIVGEPVSVRFGRSWIKGEFEFMIRNLSVLLLLACAIARADFSYTMTSKSSMGGNPSVSKYYFKGNKMKTETATSVIIMDFDAQTITTVNPSDKTYTVKPFSVSRAQRRPAPMFTPISKRPASTR